MGEPITLVDERGKPLSCGPGRSPGRRSPPGSIISAATRPFSQPQPWSELGKRGRAACRYQQTTAYRVVHGEGDFLPGLRIERYGDVFVIMQRARCLSPYRVRRSSTCLDPTGQGPCSGTTHHCLARTSRRSASPANAARLSSAKQQDRRQPRYGPSNVAWTGPARPLMALPPASMSTNADPGNGCTSIAAGKRVLNLFAYSGLFSLSLLRGRCQPGGRCRSGRAGPGHGSRSCRSQCHLSDRHLQHEADCLSWCRNSAEQFDIIICDPPTAAQGADKKSVGKASWQETKAGCRDVITLNY